MGYENVRIFQERKEIEQLCEYAARSSETLGRDRNERKCEIRTAYQRDRDRILYS